MRTRPDWPQLDGDDDDDLNELRAGHTPNAGSARCSPAWRWVHLARRNHCPVYDNIAFAADNEALL